MERRYCITNWKEYNRSLINRGNITIWIDQKSIDQWFSRDHSCEAGRPKIYSDEAIVCLLVLREVFKLPLRALQGFAASIFAAMGIDFPVPSYSQISRRAGQLEYLLSKFRKKKNIRDIVFDSTGLKVHGEGEWKVKQHGKSKRRTWKKLHLGIDPDTHEVVVAEITDSSTTDAEVGKDLLKRFKKVNNVYGDGAYDTKTFRREVKERGGISIIPPRENAVYKGEFEGWKGDRDGDIAVIHALGGDKDARRIWKVLKGYHRRSLGETAFYRIKTMFGSQLKSRREKQQRAEVLCKVVAMNKMTDLGIPRGEWVS